MTLWGQGTVKAIALLTSDCQTMMMMMTGVIDQGAKGALLLCPPPPLPHMPGHMYKTFKI